MRVFLYIVLICCASFVVAAAETSQGPPRCEVVPLAGNQLSLRIDGGEVTRWHFGSEYPRPFFFPYLGPSGESLTRMGHPGAPDHDHHRSIWFAHNALEENDFWSDRTKARVRQKQWLALRDGDEEAVMAVRLGWYGASGEELLEQDLVAALRPLEGGESLLEIQATFRPASGRESVQLAKTNFGFLAVRVAKSISAHFGGGRLSDSEGRVGEKEIFGRRNRWMDYSGKNAVSNGTTRHWVSEGLTFFDHPENPRYPSHWHVRSDGWMGASFGLAAAYTIEADEPLELRYLLHAHGGKLDLNRAAQVAEAFGVRPGFEVRKSTRSHRHFDVQRRSRDGR